LWLPLLVLPVPLVEVQLLPVLLPLVWELLIELMNLVQLTPVESIVTKSP
jgi:hypothetical protein